LEKASSAAQASVLDTIHQQALRVISDEDLERLHDVAERGASLSECTPEERAALERYQVAYDRATQSIGRGLTARAVQGSRGTTASRGGRMA
jgi:hypothetical protein